MKDKLSILIWGVLRFLCVLISKQKHHPYTRSLLTRVRRRLADRIIVSLNEAKFHPIDLQSLYILTSMYERELWNFFKPRKGDVFIDVGAHIGKYTVITAKIVGEDGLVIAIEPHPQNYKTLMKNVMLNRLTNVIAFRLAAWSTQQNLKLYTADKSGNHSVIRRTPMGFIKVRGKPIDDVVMRLGLSHIDWIKIDVEGAEFHVIKGLYNTIKKYKPRLIIEVMDKRVFRLMRELGYSSTPILSKTKNYYFEWKQKNQLKCNFNPK